MTNDTPPSGEFRQRLKAELLEERRKKPMKKTTFSFSDAWRSFSLMKLSGAVAVLVLVALIGTATYQYFGRGRTVRPVGTHPLFSTLVIQAAYASDNFTLEPATSDSLGVAPDVDYVLKSKTPLDTDLIRENLTIIPEATVDIKEISPTEWQVILAEPLEPNAVVKVELDASYVGDDGQKKERDFGWAFQVKDHFKVLSTIPRHASNNVPTDTGIEVKFSHDNFTDFEKFFSLEPSVEGKFEKHGRTLVFVPKEKLEAGKIYTATVKQGLPLVGSSETLATDDVFSFETAKPYDYGDKQPWISTRDTGDYAPGQDIIVETNARNVPGDKITVDVYSLGGWQDYLTLLKKRDRLPWWSYSKQDYLADTTGLTKMTSFSAPIEEKSYVRYVHFPQTLPAGYYVAVFSSGKAMDQTWLQVSDVSAYLNITKDKTIVWTNDLAAKAPISGASAQVVDLGASAVTDVDGVATFPTPPEVIKGMYDETRNERYYVKVQSGEGTIIIPAVRPFILDRYYFNGNDMADADNYWRYLYTDRPMYKPNDVIKFWGLIRDRAAGAQTVGQANVTLYKEGYVDYYYQPVRILQQDVALTPGGTFSGELKLENLRPDYYTVELRVGDKIISRKYLQIQAYVKPAYQLELTAVKTSVFAGDTVHLTARASFFEGTPVPGLKLNYETPTGTTVVTTDTQGQVQLTFTKPYAESEYDNAWPQYVYVRISPTEGELADIFAEANLVFYGPKVYLMPSVDYPDKGQAKISMKARILDLDAINNGTISGEDWRGKEPAVGTKIEGQVTRISYVAKETGTQYDFISKRTYKTYDYTRQTEVVGVIGGTTDAQGNFDYLLTTVPDSSYEIKLKSVDAEGRVEKQMAYAYYFDGRMPINPWANNGEPYYHLAFPKDVSSFAVGQEVKVNFLNNQELLPAGGPAHFLYVQLQNGLHGWGVSNDPTYSFTFQESDIPDVDIVGVYFNGNTYVSGYGMMASFKNEGRKLNVKVTPGKDHYAPGETVTLAVESGDTQGNPVSAEVNLNLVDEAFYALVNDYAAPLDTIYLPVDDGSLYTGNSHSPPERNTFFDRFGMPMAMGLGGAEKGGCFAAGTKIDMADGSQKPIEQVKAGDKISTLADPRRLETVTGTVTETYRHVISHFLVINGKLRVTPEHRVFANESFRTAGELKAGDLMLGEDGRRIRVESIEERRDTIRVYNFRVDPQHTFFADGFFVHNEKGGGPREFFTDAAAFQSVTTGGDGKGTATFKLPDNITSWRVTAQGISQNLLVGSSVSKIPVSLPVFADVAVNDEYLLADKPVAKLRAYGTALATDDAVAVSFLAPTLGLDRSATYDGLAFASIYLPLPSLTIGRHPITYELKTAKGNDSLKLPIDVIASRLMARDVIMEDRLTTQTTLSGSGSLPMVIVLSDAGQNTLYWPLVELASSWGGRVDQMLGRSRAVPILNSVYKEQGIVPQFNGSQFQMADGGIALLPYGDSDIALSARLAALAPDAFDQTALRSYFFVKLEDAGSTPEEVTYALYGLAALGEPVLARMNDWLQRTDLTPAQRIVMGLAADASGQREIARNIFTEIIDKYSKTDASEQRRIQASDDTEQIAEATAQMAQLAASLDLPERDSLWAYVRAKPPKDTLLSLEKLAYVTDTITRLKPSPAKVVYDINGRQQTAVLTGGGTHSFSIEPQLVGQLHFTVVEGDVGITVSDVRPATDAELGKSSDVGMRREFYVNGQPSSTFKETDLIEVRLYPQFNDGAPADDQYQLTDYLPGGLIPVAPYRTFGLNGCNNWYPYEVDQHQVVFRLPKTWNDRSWFYCGDQKQVVDHIQYYARVKTRGTYYAEPATLQSYQHPDVINRSAGATVTIE